MIHPPTHLHYFNRRSVEILLRKNGMQMVEFSHVGVRRRLISIFYHVFKKGLGLPAIYELAGRCVPANMGITVNMFDIMSVVARKE